MRRSLHCLLVGVLTFSLSCDAARACWQMRRACRVHCCPPPVCVPVAACRIDPCCRSWTVVTVPYAIPAAASWVTTTGGCCGGEEIGAHFAPVVTSESAVVPGVESVVAAPVEPAPASGSGPVAPPESVVAAAPAAERPLAVLPGSEAAAPAEPRVPELQPLQPAPEPDAPAVKPASNDEPTLEPVPPTRDREEEPNVAPQTVVPQEENLFEKVERRAGEPAASDAANPAAESSGAAGSDADAPAAGAAPAAAPVEESVEPSAAPADEAAPPTADGLPQEPASPAADSTEPASPAAESAADPTDAAAREPLRRWIDASESYAVVAAVVAVGPDRVVLLRADGREISVPIAKLSAHDRAYAREAGERIAARRTVAPASRDTAGSWRKAAGAAGL